MGLKVAVASGNWSNPAIWSAGILPLPEDFVATNGFTVTLDQNITALGLTNTAQSYTSVVPAMTGYTTPSGIVTASDAGYGNNPFAVFSTPAPASGEPSNWTTSVAGPQWVAYEFTSSQIIKVYMVGAQNSGLAPKNWTFEAWNGSSWIVLDTQINQVFTTATLTYNISNTTSYSKYRLFVSLRSDGLNGNFSMRSLRMFTSVSYMQNSVAGGGFVLTNGVTVTCTNELRSGNSTLLLWSGTTGNTIVSPKAVGAGSGRLIDVAGTGTLNINITTLTGVGGVAPTLVHVGAAATVNIVGTFQTVADLRGTMLNIAAAATVNVTGSFIRDVFTNAHFYTIAIVAANSILNITGDIITGNVENYWGYEWNITSTYTINITGSLKTIAVPYPNSLGIFSTTAGYLKVIGPIITYGNNVVYRNTNSLAINLFTGPFVCSTYGYVPLQVVRMHLIPTTSSYFEFRDETTNGALSPGAIAPATQLVSPATLISNLATSDVRFGIVYALGTLTGTLRMPSANQVTFGVAVDNTFGNSVLTAASIWDYLVSNITTADSIGMRLKNVSTPQTTGEQLEAFLRLD
jgi:hypothetical protein